MSHWNKNKNEAKGTMKGNTVWWKNHKEVHLGLRLIGRACDCSLMLFSLLEPGGHLPLTVLCGHQSHMPTVQAWPPSPIKASSTQLCWSTKEVSQYSSSCSGNWSPQCIVQWCLLSRHNKAIFTFSRLLVKTRMPPKMKTEQHPSLGLTGLCYLRAGLSREQVILSWPIIL